MNTIAETEGRTTMLESLRMAMGELFGAERRLRGRESQQSPELTHSQLRALVVIGRQEEVTAGELAKSADLNPASVTAMLDQLEATGIVERRRTARTGEFAWFSHRQRTDDRRRETRPLRRRCGTSTSGVSPRTSCRPR